MKVFTIKRIIPPNILSRKNFKTFAKVLLSLLIYIQQYNAYSFSRNISSTGIASSKSKHAVAFQNFNSLEESLNPTKFSFLEFKKNNLLNQITLNSILKSSYCTGETGTIEFETSGTFNSSNRFSVQISNFNGSFSSPTVIGFINRSAVGVHTVSFKIPLSLPIGNGYRVRIVASNPTTTSLTNGANIQITTLAVPSVAVSSQIICPGGSANLSATCTTGAVKWYDLQEGGNLITVLTVSPSISTDYFVACESGGICSSVRARQIVIVNKPDVLIPPYASSCLNSDLELAVVTEEVNLNYSWTGPSGFTSTLQNPTITNLTTTKEGIYSVSIMNANSCLVTGTTSVNIGTVLQNLSVIGDVAVCFADTIKLSISSAVPAGMTYSWSGPDSYTFVGQNLARPASTFNGDGSITYHAGLYSIVANNATTGCTGNTALSISVSTRPSIPLVLPAGSVCIGADYAFNLALSGANFTKYSWNGPNGFTASATAICDTLNNCGDIIRNISNFSSLNAGIYTLKARYLDANSLSCEVKAVKNITLKPLPDIDITSNSVVCLGDLLLFNTTYNPTITEISSFSWTGPNSFTSNIQNPRINTTSLAEAGTYKLTAVGINLCVGTATTFANIVESVPPLVIPTANVVLSNSITLTATGCPGSLNWHQSADNQSVTMPVSPIVPTSYYAKCNVFSCVSGRSGDILVSINPPIAISSKTGDWEDKETWDIKRVPLSIDSVIIRPTHYITIHSQAYAKWLAWTGYGNLIFSNASSSLKLFGTPLVVNPSVITSSPTTVYEGVSVAFTATGTGVISWYKNGIDLGISGTTYTVSNPIKDDIYTAKRTLSSVTSAISNAITVIAAPPVSPPELSSSPSTVYEATSVTFTATGSGEISWYKNGVSLGITGSTYTVSNPVKDDVYTAKRTLSGITSNLSNSITVLIAPPITAPVLSSSPYIVYEGISVTFTATGAGTILWYKNGASLGVTGTTYIVNIPVKDDVYTTKRTESGLTSGVSNAITVVASPPPTSSEVVIIEPNKPPYYFSDGHPPSHYNGNLNLPVIFTNQPRYDPDNDFVWLRNDKIKIGINLKRGGQLAWASLINATTNLVYNGYDGGFQVTLDAYQKKDGYTQGGEVSGSGIPGQPAFSYNVTQGGDYNNHAASLIDYHSVPNGFYVKLRPIHYPLNAKFSETYIEATYTIIGRSVKIDYRYTSFRSDGQWTGSGFDGAGAPACFIVNTLNKYKTFTGSSPWSFLPTEGGNLPIQNMGQTPAGAHSTEYWGMVYDSNNPNSGIGVYNATNGGSSTYFTFKQLEVYPGNGPGTEFNSGFTFFQPFIDFNITNRGNYVKDITAYLMIGSELEIRSEVYKFSGHEANIPRF